MDEQMRHFINLNGQSVDYRDSNDNAPPRYSAPSTDFKAALAELANPNCSRCRGTGYLGRFKHICAGRCFQCVPDSAWELALKGLAHTRELRTEGDEWDELYQAVSCDDSGKPAYLCDGLWIEPDETRRAFALSDASHGAPLLSRRA